MPRPQRRKHKTAEVSTSIEVPRAHPKPQQRNSTTLVDLIAERSNDLHGASAADRPLTGADIKPEIVSIKPDGRPANWPRPPTEDEVIGPLGEAIFYGMSLAMIHFTFDVLVHSQFAESFALWELAPRSLIGLIILVAMVYFLQPNARTWWAQLLFFIGSVSAGCQLVTITSRYSYLAVMKQAPPLGTLWIWAVIEQRPDVALAGLIAVGIFFWWGGAAFVRYEFLLSSMLHSTPMAAVSPQDPGSQEQKRSIKASLLQDEVRRLFVAFALVKSKPEAFTIKDYLDKIRHNVISEASIRPVIFQDSERLESIEYWKGEHNKSMQLIRALEEKITQLEQSNAKMQDMLKQPSRLA